MADNFFSKYPVADPTSGTVTSVTAGTGLNVGAGPGGSITSTGTLNLANTAVTPGSYTNANITVDQQGRLTAAANGGAAGANTALSNLASVAINTSLLPGLDDTINLGSSALRFNNGFIQNLLGTERIWTLDATGADSLAMEIWTGDSDQNSGSMQIYTGEGVNTGLVLISSGYGSSTSGAVTVQTGDVGGGGGTSGQLTLITGDSDNTSGALAIRTGIPSVEGQSSGGINIESGAVPTGGGSSGNLNILSGASVGSSSAGGITIQTGAAEDGNSGPLQLTTGAATGTGDSSGVNILSGNAGDTSGDITIATGTGGNVSGNIVLQTGAATTQGKTQVEGGLLYPNYDKQFSAANNQVVDADITGLLFDSDETAAFTGVLSLKIDALVPQQGAFRLEGTVTATGWQMNATAFSVSDAEISNFSITITLAGQVQYTSPNLAGFVSNDMTWAITATKNPS